MKKKPNTSNIALGFRSSVQPEIKAFSDKITFGKYKGRTVEDVIEIDPGYILWMHDEKKVIIRKEIVDAADEAETDMRFDEAMDGELKGMRFWDIYNDNEH